MRVHARILNTRNAAILCSALASYIVHPNMHGALNLPQEVYPAMSIVEKAPGQPFTDADMIELMRRLDIYVTRNPDLRPLPHSERRVTDSSSLFLLLEYANGQIGSASGTIVKGSHDRHNVLSVGHMLPEGEGFEVQNVFAFDGEGAFIARLAPLAHVNLQTEDMSQIVSFLMNDLSALTPVEFASARAEQAWNDRAAPLAPEQSAHPLLVLNALGDESLNPGMSGGALKNDQGQVIGVMALSRRVYEKEAADLLNDMAYIDKIASQDVDGVFSQQIERMRTLRLGADTSTESIGYAAPVLHPEIREALGVGAAMSVQGNTPMVATLAAFPGMKAVTSRTHVTPIQAYDAAAFINEDLTQRHDEAENDHLDHS